LNFEDDEEKANSVAEVIKEETGTQDDEKGP
jgi:hypothetical protein